MAACGGVAQDAFIVILQDGVIKTIVVCQGSGSKLAVCLSLSLTSLKWMNKQMRLLACPVCV